MKKLLFVLFLIIGTHQAFSQKMSYGVSPGINFYQFYSNQPVITGNEYKPGIQANIYVEYQINDLIKLHFEPGFVSRGTKTSSDFPEYTHKLNYLNFPFLLYLSPVKRLSIQVGPEIAYRLTAKTTLGEETTDSKDVFDSKFDWGTQMGLGYNLSSNMTINLRYYRGFKTVIKDLIIPNGEFGEIVQKAKLNNQGFAISLSYRIK